MSEETPNKSRAIALPLPHPVEFVPRTEATTRYKAVGRAATLELQKNLRLEDTLKQKDAELQKQHTELTVDAKTGLANERRLLEVLEWATAREDKKPRGKESNLGLLMFDLDKFKKLNDTLGHDTGDRVLGTIGRTLSTMLRGSDVTAHADLEDSTQEDPTATRKHGDEFFVIVPEVQPLHPDTIMTRQERMEALAERVRDGVMEAIYQEDYAPLLDEHDVQLGLSLGSVLYDRGEGMDSFMKRADEAMYVDKRSRGAGRE